MNPDPLGWRWHFEYDKFTVSENVFVGLHNVLSRSLLRNMCPTLYPVRPDGWAGYKGCIVLTVPSPTLLSKLSIWHFLSNSDKVCLDQCHHPSYTLDCKLVLGPSRRGLQSFTSLMTGGDTIGSLFWYLASGVQEHID